MNDKLREEVGTLLTQLNITPVDKATLQALEVICSVAMLKVCSIVRERCTVTGQFRRVCVV